MRTLIGTLLACFALCANANAQSPWFELPTPAGALDVLGVDVTSGTAPTMQRTMRVLHSAPRTGEPPPAILSFEQLLRDLDAVEGEAQRLGKRGLSLAMARNSSERDVLHDVLKVLGFELRERRNVYTVEASRDQNAVRLRERLGALGFETATLEKTLNTGGTLTVAPKETALPSPLPLDTWSSVIFERPLSPRAVFGAIARDREAALLLIGLSAMTPATRAYLVAHPRLLRHLHRNSAAAVAAFGEIFQIDSAGRLVLPGGPPATALWEGLVGEQAENVEDFAQALFDHDSGRLAYFTDTVLRLDPARQKFALGLWMPDQGVRLDRLRALHRTFAAADSNWSVSTSPFTRPYYDPALLLTVVQVNPDGTLARPAHRRFWRKALDGLDLPSNGGRELDDVTEEGTADAAWLAEQVWRDLPEERRALLRRVAFGQRIFGSVPDTQLETALTALRAFGRYPALLLATERVGVRSPATFVAVARRASALDALGDSSPAIAALGQFQGALALLTRIARTGVIDVDQRERLVASLATVEMREGHYAGAIAAWMSSELVPALPRSADPMRPLETTLLHSLADRAEVQTFEWEGESYVVNVRKASSADLIAIRSKQGGNSLDAVLAVAEVIRSLQQPKATVDDIKKGAAALKAAGAPLVPLRPWADSDDRPSDVRRILERAVRDLERINKPKDVEKANGILRPLAHLVDDLLAETLVSLAYTPSLEGSATRLGAQADISHRHRFGLRATSAVVSDYPAWQRTMSDTARLDGAGFTGSLLAVDLVHAPRRLRRLSTNTLPPAARMNNNDVATVSETVALMNPREMTTADLMAIGEALARGRRRVREADSPTLDALATEVLMPGERRQALAWAHQTERARVERLFSMTELLVLGGTSPTDPTLDAWGTTAEPLSGCFCLRFPPPGSWYLLKGRPGTSLLGSAIPDVTLRIAEHLASLRVPAALVGGVASLATQAFIDSAAAMYHDDWAGIVGYAHELSRETVEDYVAAVVASGPVSPAGQ